MEWGHQLTTILVAVACFMNNFQSGHGDNSAEHQRSKRAEYDFNYTGMWISNGVMIAFVSLIVLYGLYKSYIGEVHMPIKKEAPSTKNEENGAKTDDAELSAVNPAYIDDHGLQPSAGTQTDFPDVTETSQTDDTS
ncbi:hypothetical protein BSL78_00120 [Apostichopus japonicus]|uniref:Uncharacterized protein n=1 Tax=Stichopus japonicus TaxID=307972 RepID=A0A2G8LRV8_STIJA|nr:hypothetical protein BSL78_00120 [Apostichopus japonicus]